MQLRDANKTNEKLRDKILELQSGNQKRVNDLQEKVTDLQEKLTELRIENQALKSHIEFMQMQPGRYSAHQGFHSQPPPFQNASSFSASSTSAHVSQGPSHGDFDPSLNNDFFSH
jgi:TolA-binding protein